MRPKPFVPVVVKQGEPFVRDQGSGLVWHRVFHRPLYADTDRSGAVYHANYLRYFELGRASLMRDIGYPYNDVEGAGYLYPVVDTRLFYHRPLFYDEPIWVNTRPAELHRVKVKFDYIITHAKTGDVLCSGYTMHCAVDSNGRVVSVDQATVRLWREFPEKHTEK